MGFFRDYSQGLDPASDGDGAQQAFTYLEAGEYDKAIAHCDQALHLNPHNPLAYFVRGSSFDERGQREQAIADFTEAIRLDPNCVFVYISRAACYLEQGQLDNSIADLTEAIRLDPNHALAYHLRGIAHAQKGISSRAQADREQANRLDPSLDGKNNVLGLRAPARRRQRGWIWFFLALVALSLVAMASLIAYNLGQQLKPEQLAEARQLWKQKGLKSYQLSYTVRRGPDLSIDTYVVRVRSGKVVSSTVNERPEPLERFAARGMEALFYDIQRFMEMDAEPNRPRTYTRAIFDGNHGGLRWYVRRVMGGAQRVEIIIDSLEPLLETHSD